MPRYINIYVHNKAWGGVEEGGWWYDTFTPIYGHLIPTSGMVGVATTAKLMKYNTWAADENAHRRSDINSVISEGAMEVYVEKHEGAYSPRETPHYE